MPYSITGLFARGYHWLAERLYNELAWAYDPVSWMVSLGQWDGWRRSLHHRRNLRSKYQPAIYFTDPGLIQSTR